MPNRLKAQPAALIETFTRFQAGFLPSEDFHPFLLIFMGFHRFSWVFIDFGDSHAFSLISEHGMLQR